MTSTNVNGLNSKQSKALALLAAGEDVTTVAKEVKVSASTVYRWADKPIFSKTLREARAKHLSLLGSKLLKSSLKAVDVLESALDSEHTPASKIQAAKALLTSSLRVNAAIESTITIAQLEEKISSLSPINLIEIHNDEFEFTDSEATEEIT